MTGLESTRLDELRRALREQAGLDIATLRPASGGESATVWWATDRAGSVTVVKVMPEAGPDAPDRLRALPALVARLRDAAATRRHLRLARLVIADIGD